MGNAASTGNDAKEFGEICEASVTIPLNPTVREESQFEPPTALEKYIKRNLRKECPSGTQVLSKTTSPGIVEYGQGLLDALFLAYDAHLNLVLSPDHFWLTILIGFNIYMRKHSELMRQVFVNFEGQTQLIIDCDDTFASQDWPQLLSLFEQKISENITPGMTEALLPNFTSSTPHLRSVAQILLMGAFKNYFAYECMTGCGIPSVTMQGTLEDWYKLKTKIQFLGTLAPDLNAWAQILEPVLNQLIATYEGHPDINWWNCCIHYQCGSGLSDLSGWCLAFFPFDYDGLWQLNPVSHIFRTGQYGSVRTSRFNVYRSVQVPVKFNDNGVMYDVMLLAESRQADFEDASSTVKPGFEWALLQLPAGTIQDDQRSVVKPKDYVPALASIDSKHHQHPLSRFEVSSWIQCQCSVCDSSRTVFYSCRSCDVDVCLKCLQGEKDPISSPQHSHPLTFFIVPPGLPYKCDGCGLLGMQTTYACRVCNYDLCMKCADN